MAQLHKEQYNLPPIVYGQNLPFQERFRAHEEAFEALRAKHEMVSFGVADGFAWYIVKSRKPLVLQHVDYCDGYAASAALIRGLRLADIDAQTRRARMGFKF